jgi:hypothetical protein
MVMCKYEVGIYGKISKAEVLPQLRIKFAVAVVIIRNPVIPDN